MLVVGDYVVVLQQEELQLVVLVVGVEWLVVVEDDWLVFVLVFVEDLGVVWGGDIWYDVNFFGGGGYVG